MLSVQPTAPSASALPSKHASGQGAAGPRLKRALTTTRVGVDASPTTIHVRPPASPSPSSSRPAMDFGQAARSVMAAQAASAAGDDKPSDPWSAVIRKAVRKAGGGVRPVSQGESGSGASKPGSSLAQLLRSRKVKNLVRQAMVAREWSSSAAQSADKAPSMVMEQWVRTAARRSEQSPRRRQGANASNNSEGEGADDAVEDPEGGSDVDTLLFSSSASSISSDGSLEAQEAPRGASDALQASRQAYSRHLLLEESCHRALAQSGDRRSDMDLQALRSWFQTTKLKISTGMDRMPPAQLDTLCRRMTGVSLAPGEVVFRQGDEGDALYVVLRGSVEVRVGQRVLGEQLEVTVCELSHGDYFGERSLLSNDARAATVVATSATELVKIARADYDLTLRNDQLEFLSRVQMSNGGRALAPHSLQQSSQREYLRILGTSKRARSKADVARLGEYLQTLKFFRALPAAFVRELSAVVELASVSAGDVIFREGELGDLFYILLSGSVDVLVASAAADGGAKAPQTKLVNLTDGEHFGELALMKGRGVRSATVVAREDCKLLVLCEKDYNATLRRLQKRDLARRVALLGRVARFQTPEWTRERLRELSYVLVDLKLATGAVLFSQGDKAQHVYFVVRGELVAERTLVDPLAKPTRSGDALGSAAITTTTTTTTTVVVERVSRFRMVGGEAASGATFKEPTFREVTMTASTPVELLVLSKYDVFHRLPPAMRDALLGRSSSSGSSGNSSSNGDGFRIEPVLYVDRFVKSVKWDELKRRVVREHVDHERVAKRMAATARASSSTRCSNQDAAKSSQPREPIASSWSLDGAGNTPLVDVGRRPQRRASGSRNEAGACRPLRPLVDANELLLVPSERDAIANSFMKADCVEGHASLARYVTGFNADAPPSDARSRQLRDVLAAERRRDAHILNEGNPLAYFDADEVRRQHRLQLQQHQQEEGESWSRQSSSRRLMPAAEDVAGRRGSSPVAGASITASMSRCLQDNYICSLPANPNDRRPRRLRTDSSSTSPHREHSSDKAFSTMSAASGGDPGGDGDFSVVRLRFTYDGDAGSEDKTGVSPSRHKVVSALQVIQSVRSPLDASEAARASLETSSSAQSADDSGAGRDVDSAFFVVPKGRFALPPGIPKAREQQLQQQIVERFGRWPAASTAGCSNDGCNSPAKAPPSLSAFTSSPSNSSTPSSSWSTLFASFDEVTLPTAETTAVACQEGGGQPEAKAFAVVSMVLSRREIVNGSSDEPFVCVHDVFASETEAMHCALHLDPPPLRSALVCVLPARQWVRLEDAYERCVQVEPDRRERRASSSTLVVPPYRNKPPTRPVLGSGASFKASIAAAAAAPSAWLKERVEAARLHQFICARMGMPRNAGGGGDDSGFTPKPTASLEDKLAALQEYLDASSANVTTSRSAALATAEASASAMAASGIAALSGGGNATIAGATGVGGGSRLLGRVRQVKHFGSILRSRIRGHDVSPTAGTNASLPSPPRASISASIHSRRATDTIL